MQSLCSDKLNSLFKVVYLVKGEARGQTSSSLLQAILFPIPWTTTGMSGKIEHSVNM